MSDERASIINHISCILEKADFESHAYDSFCFDIIARKGKTITIFKALVNIDGMRFEQAKNLRIISSRLNAFSAIIGLRTRQDIMEDSIVYERFGIAAFTPNTLENIMLAGERPFVYRDRGGLFAEIDNEKMKNARKDKNLTQEGLACIVGVSKKNVYEHERRSMKMLLSVALEMRKALGKDIFRSMDDSCNDCKNKTSNPEPERERKMICILRKIGINTCFIYKAPFNLILDEKENIFTGIETNASKRSEAMQGLKRFSEITEMPALFVASKKTSEKGKCLPVMCRDDMARIKSREEFLDALKTRW